MRLGRVLGTVLVAGLICQCKKSMAREDSDPSNEEIKSVASYGLLEDLEAEDSYLGSELSDADIEREIEAKSADLKKQLDKNQDGLVTDQERQQLKSLFKDKMLEKFDVDSDGSFSHVEGEAILEQIRMHIEEFRRLHPESFSDKRPVVCKVVHQRGGPRPLWQNLLEKCEG